MTSGVLKGRTIARRRLRSVGTMLVVALIAGGVLACGQSGKSPTPPSTSQVVRLGALVPLSGENTPTGRRVVEAFQMAVKEANDAGGVLGHPVELVTGDDACDAGTAVVKANEIVAKDITVSVGGVCSQATVPTLKVFREAGIPMIITDANSSDLLVPGYDSVFLFIGTTTMEAQYSITAMAKLGTHRLALIDDGTTFSQALAAATVAGIHQPGSAITLAAQKTLSQGASSYASIVEAVLHDSPDMVFFTGYYPAAAKLIRDLRAAGYTGNIMLSDGGTDPALFTLLNATQLEGVYCVMVPVAQFEPRATAWAERYRAAYGKEPGPGTMQAYDVVRLALNAIQRAGSLDHTAIRKAIADTAPADIELLSGTGEFNADGTRVNPNFVVLKIHNGAFTLVRQDGSQPGLAWG